MNINIKLPQELEEKITVEANKRLSDMLDNILENDEEINTLIKQTIKGQVKSIALLYLQSPDLRTRMAQKVYPIVYETLGLTERKDELCTTK